MKFRYYSVLFLLIIFSINNLMGQVSIAPSSIFIDDRTNSGSLYVSNRSNETQEVTIEFTFGYPSSSDDGVVTMVYDNEEMKGSYGIDDLIRAFPRSFTLAPQEQQTVRFQMRPMMQSPDGVYWTRVRVLANPQTTEIGITDQEQIATRITFRFEQIIAAFYKKGNTSTGITVEGVDVKHENGTTILLPRIKRTGNSPYIGTITANVYNQSGTLVAERQSNIAAYFDEVRRVEFDSGNLPSGRYRVDLVFETRRGDISPNDLVQAQPIRQTIDITIP